MPARLQIDSLQLAEFCHRHHIRRLALFGSVLRDDFGPESDVDVLYEFEPGFEPGWDIETHETLVARMGAAHPITLACAINQAGDLRALGRSEEAESTYSDTMAAFYRVLGRDHPATKDAAGWHRANCDMYPMPL